MERAGMSATPPVERLKKELGLFDVYAISTGAMFSSGFFLLPGLAAAKTGPSVPLAYFVAGIFILPAMLSVAELATAMPRAGGAYYFLDRALGPLVGTVGGLGTWVALMLKSAFALVGMGAYLAIFVEVPIRPLAIVLTVVFMLVNIIGTKETGGLQRVLVAALLVILTFFIVQGLIEVGSLGFVEVTRDQFTPFLPYGFNGFMATVGFVFVSYAGLTKVASVSEEVRNPDRNIPLGMGLSLATASVVYTLGVYIIVAVLDPVQLRGDLAPVATAAQEFFDWLPGSTGVLLIVIAALAAFASTGNAGIMSASRYPLAMARDRLVAEPFGRIGRFQTPVIAILATGGVMILAILALDIEGIAKLASAFQLLLFALLNLAVIIMRESRIEGYDPGFRSPLYPWMQIIGTLTPFWLITEMGEMAIVFTLGLVALTTGWYFYYARPRVERSGAIFHTFARWGEGRYAGLDLELRGIVKEKGLREEDPFDRVVARAGFVEIQSGYLAEAIGLGATQLASRTGLPAEVFREGFLRELEVGFVPVARGAAMPHLRLPGLEHPDLLLARALDGVRLQEAGGAEPPSEPVHAVFFLVSPADKPGQHLRLLGHLATHVDDEAFLPQWLAARDEHELKETLLREERALSLHLDPAGPARHWIGQSIRDVDLPTGSLVALIRRRGHGIVPRGSTVLEEGDRLTIIGEPEAIRELAARYGRRGALG